MNIRIYSVALAGVVLVSLGGVSQSKTAPPEAQRTSSDAVRATCPDLPTDAPPMAGLKTAWAMHDSNDGIRLVFSDQIVACQNFDGTKTSARMNECVKSWQFAFTLSPELQKPGVYDLHDYEAEYTEAVVTPLPSQGCKSGPSCLGSGMGSAGGGKGPDSTIEIYSVTEECVTGRILRLERGMDNSGVDFTGAFQAIVCAPSSP